MYKKIDISCIGAPDGHCKPMGIVCYMNSIAGIL